MTRSLRSAWRLGAIAAALVVVACQPAASTAPSSEPAESATAAPTANEAAAFPVTITDAAGVEHTFNAPPKIGCLWTGCDEGLADLGLVPDAGSFPLGIGSPFYYPLGDPPAAVSDWSDAEQWANAGVDIIVVGGTDTSWTEPIAQAADILALHYPSEEGAAEGVEQHKANIRQLGQITGTSSEAEAAVERFDTFLANLREHAPADSGDPSVAILFPSDDGTYNLVAPNGSFCGVLAAEGWGHCLAPEGYAGGQINAEAFLAENPDWIVYQAFEDMTADARTDEVWGQLDAVKNGQVYDSFGDYDCCSLRSLEYALQDFASQVWGAEAGVPDPGPQLEFDLSTSPLISG